jgi:hypothetical protein
VAILPRQPGTKESRYAHLLSGPVEFIATTSAEAPAHQAISPGEDRIGRLEAEVGDLRRQVDELSQKIQGLFG